MCPHCGSENTAAVPWTAFSMFCKDCDGDFEMSQQDDDIYYPGKFRELDKFKFELPTHHPNI
jgi:hypothetical protein